MCSNDKKKVTKTADDEGLSSSTTTTAATTNTKTKTVYLIRHAESDENRRIAALSRTAKMLSKFSFPTKSDITASTELLNVKAQVDSNVSVIGAQQISHMSQKLQEADFVRTSGIQLVAHSPLLRAKQTSEGMLGCCCSSSSSSSLLVGSGAGGGGAVVQTTESTDEAKADASSTVKKHDAVQRVVVTDLLLEKTPAEWTPLYYPSFKLRIRQFEDWLGRQPEHTIALVGHSQFFKAMLGLDFKFGNCEVWKLDFDPTKTLSVDGLVSTTTTSTTTTTTAAAAASPSKSSLRRQDSTDSGCRLPPQWSNLQQIFACDVKSSPRTV